jgi:Rab GDP dissociation inhibitor
MDDIFKYHNIDDNTKDFLGHAIALHFSDEYLLMPAAETIKKM